MKDLLLYVVMVIMLILIFFVGMIGRENAIKEQCENEGEATMIIGESWRCAPIQKVKTLEEAKAIIKQHQERVK